MLVDSYIGRIRSYKRAKLAPPTVSIVTENANSPELVGLVKRAVNFQNINGQLLHVQFLFELAGDMERLLSRITEYDNTFLGVLLEEIYYQG